MRRRDPVAAGVVPTAEPDRRRADAALGRRPATDPNTAAILDALAAVNDTLGTILGVLKARRAPRLALRLEDASTALGLSRRCLERLRAAGKFPPPDRHIGKCPVWSPETVKRWVEGDSR
jgi:predicted DNA-binding transcriptional regulator AlpA